jgi:hypothetical protein
MTAPGTPVNPNLQRSREYGHQSACFIMPDFLVILFFHLVPACPERKGRYNAMVL